MYQVMEWFHFVGEVICMNELKVFLPGEDVSCSQWQAIHNAYFANEKTWINAVDSTPVFVPLAQPKGIRGDRPAPIIFAWEGVDAVEYTLKLSRHQDLHDPDRIIHTGFTSIEVYNLLLDTCYYWQVSAKKGKERYISSVRRFFTAYQVPRFLYIEGAANVRDIGGWETTDGHRVRQGLVYRSSALNHQLQITANGTQTLCDQLGARVDLDIRGADQSEPTFDTKRVEYVHMPTGSYASCVKSLQERFAVPLTERLLRTPEEPIVVHCWGGADTTGTLIILIKGVLGVPWVSLMKDYECTSFSQFGTRSRHSADISSLKEALLPYGDVEIDTQRVCEALFLNGGVTAAQLERLKEIFLQ